jgi:bifunctional non-homologous end joining protein LigD
MISSAKKLLEKYNTKRDFKKTQEPKGASGKKSKAPIFVVQKHAATRLHWDFRLELDGVLKSWAVTNEPIPDPNVKRLAVRVEDHPLSYAGFSGDIPKGQYGGGHVDIWDNGYWQPLEDPHEGLKKGKLGFILSGKRMKGHWNLVKMRNEGKRENWLLIKGKNDEAEISVSKEKKPRAIPKSVLKSPRKKSAVTYNPELALRVDKPPEDSEWLHEIKYDGYRALLSIKNGKATITTRGGQDWTERFPEIVKAAEKIKSKTCAIDGEIVVYKDDGTTDFSLLQQTLSGDLQKPMHFIAFDLLLLDNKDYKKKPLLERKKALEKLLKAKMDAISYSDHVIGQGQKFFNEANKIHVEGIISKNINSSYVGGRNGEWLKIKIEQNEEFVIGGILRRSDDPKRVGAVLLGQFEKGKFAYKGKSGTGFPKLLSDQILKNAKSLIVKTSPFTAGLKPKESKVDWLKPKLVCMINYTELTKDGLVRHGVFKGLREDKPPQEVKSEKIEAFLSSDPVIDGVKITHPDRVVYPEEGYTKLDVAKYYDRIADDILPYLKGRPVSIIRCPDGLVKKCFFQRHVSGKSAEEITQLPIKEKETGEAYFSIDTKKALLSMVQFGAIEFHPWGSKDPNFGKADRLIFDLDPDPKIDFPSIKAVAFLIKERLEKIKLTSFVKTTGGKGLHIVVSIKPEHDWDTIKKFCKDFVQDLEKDFPDAFTSNTLKTARKGKIFLDYLRNDETSTAVAPFSLRARAGAPASIPLTWAQLKNMKSLNIPSPIKSDVKKYTSSWEDINNKNKLYL